MHRTPQERCPYGFYQYHSPRRDQGPALLCLTHLPQTTPPNKFRTTLIIRSLHNIKRILSLFLGPMWALAPTNSTDSVPSAGAAISPTVSNASSPNNATQQNQAALKPRGLHNIERRTGHLSRGTTGSDRPFLTANFPFRQRAARSFPSAPAYSPAFPKSTPRKFQIPTAPGYF